MKLNTNTYSCDFCKNEIFPNYEPIGSRRGARVAICTVCGLLQTKLLADKYISQPPGSMSCDADRSSFRYTKTLVAKKYSKYLKISNLHKAKEILDIGSNRGAFINFLIENFDTKFKVTAIRNKSLGKWAAEKLGLENSKIDDYIDEVIMADFNEPGHEDVIKKILDDFQKAKISITYSEIEEILLEYEKEAINKISE